MSRILCEQCQRPTIACICRFICKIENTTAVLVLQHPSEVKQTKGTVALLSRSLSHCQVLVGEDFSQHDELNTILSNHQVLLLYPSAKAQVLSLTENDFDMTNIKHTSTNDDEHSQQPKLLIIIDGTWKKSYRMFMVSSNLQALKQVCLPDALANSGQYLIRKVAKKNALSSLEACCFALALLDNELVDNELVDNELVDNELVDNELVDNELVDNELVDNKLTEEKLVKNVSGNKVLEKMKQSADCGLYQDLLIKFAQFNQFQLSFRTRT